DWTVDKAYRDADVYFMGFQSNVFKFYKHSNLFALTSDYEGFPNVMAEALICHVPVVATDCHTGPREILNVQDLVPYTPTEIVRRTGVGSLLPMLDVVDEHKLIIWADEIEYWLKAQKPSAQAFNEITNRFTRAAMLQQWKEVIDN
ncbi:MAG: glycosyltransferase, partial [Flavipsychrobacter sp.]